jgi:hypothetical protein
MSAIVTSLIYCLYLNLSDCSSGTNGREPIPRTEIQQFESRSYQTIGSDCLFAQYLDVRIMGLSDMTFLNQLALTGKRTPTVKSCKSKYATRHRDC